jgi:hypothetical protein
MISVEPNEDSLSNEKSLIKVEVIDPAITFRCSDCKASYLKTKHMLILKCPLNRLSNLFSQ